MLAMPNIQKSSNSGYGLNKPNYLWLRTTTDDTEQRKVTRTNPENQLQQGQKRQQPNKTNLKLQTAMDAAARTLNGWRKGTPETNNNKDFKTVAARNMGRILTINGKLGPQRTVKLP